MSDSYEFSIYPSEGNPLQHIKYKITKKESILGKSKFKCDVILQFSDVSDVHAKLIINGPNDYMIRDLNSDTGVFLCDSETGIKQRINPGKDYDIMPNVPFYVSRYKCVFSEGQSNIKDNKNEEPVVLKEVSKKPIPVYAKKFKPKTSAQTEIKEEIDDDLVFKNKIQEENQKRLKELKEIEEKQQGEENDQEEKQIKNEISFEEEDRESGHVQMENKNISIPIMKQKSLKLNKLKRMNSIKSDFDEELDQEKKKIQITKDEKIKSQTSLQTVDQPENKQIIKKKKIELENPKKIQINKPKKPENQSSVHSEDLDKKSRKFPINEAKKLGTDKTLQSIEYEETKQVSKKLEMDESNKLENKENNKEKEETLPEKPRKKRILLHNKEENKNVNEGLEEENVSKPDAIFDKFQFQAKNKEKKEEKISNKAKKEKTPEVENQEKEEEYKEDAEASPEKPSTKIPKQKIEKAKKKKNKEIKDQNEDGLSEHEKRDTSNLPIPNQKQKKRITKASTSTKEIEVPEQGNEKINDDLSNKNIEEKKTPRKTSKSKKTTSSYYKVKLQIGISGFLLDEGDIIMMNALGVKIIENKEKPINYLVLKSFRRTIRLLLAINKGIEIIDKKWIDDCIEKGEILDPMNYIFQDKENEKTFGFKFQESLLKARENNEGVFHGYSIWVSKNVSPSYEEIKLLIIGGNGTVLKKKPFLGEEKTILIMSNEETKEIEKLKEAGYKIYSTEFIFSACLRQQMELENYFL